MSINRKRLFRILAVLAAVTAYATIVLGGTVRGMDAGMACPDWPLCNGSIVPELGNPSVAVEYAHRLVAALTSLFILLVALSAWFVSVPVSHAAASPGAGFWVVAAEAALGGTFLAGLVSLVVGLLPLRELDGSTLKSWSTAGWVAVYLVGVYAYVQIILRPAAATGSDPHGQMWKALVAAGVFAALCVSFWAYFRFRSREGEASPAPEPG